MDFANQQVAVAVATAVVAVTAVAWTFRTKKPASIRDEAAAPEASIREDTAACSCGDTAECIAAKKQLEEARKETPDMPALLESLVKAAEQRKGPCTFLEKNETEIVLMCVPWNLTRATT
ncbi:hypothetical protein T484DRAFT_1785839 [Baffinella frigidus]|nr:hypothetical protein T484DRAFT_1785839 [Cryptophyta sp. CCMP2293]